MKKVFLLLVISILIFGSCTENQRVKQFGGDATLQLTEGKKLINATWKNDQLWLLTTDRNNTEKAKTYIFSEKSSFGIMEGSYIIEEN